MTTTTGAEAKTKGSSSKSSSAGSGAKGSGPAKSAKEVAASGSPNSGKDGDAASSPEDKYKKFEGEGVVFKAKLVGSELVLEPRGDKMCQNSIQRLKAIIKGTHSHKRRIVLKISLEGVKVYDEKTNEILHHHLVSQISYIAGDETDTRTFGYVSDVPNNAHQFICFKTPGPAINVMSVISSLFEAVLEQKNQAEKENQEGKDQEKTSTDSKQDPVDLIGDSGIMDISSGPEELPSSLAKSLTGNSGRLQQQASLQSQLSRQSSSLQALEGLDLSPASSFALPQSQMNDSLNQVNQGNTGGQSQSAGADFIFDDPFFAHPGPIMVDKNDSLIRYKARGGDQFAPGVSSSQQLGTSPVGRPQQYQQQRQFQSQYQQQNQYQKVQRPTLNLQQQPQLQQSQQPQMHRQNSGTPGSLQSPADSVFDDPFFTEPIAVDKNDSMVRRRPNGYDLFAPSSHPIATPPSSNRQQQRLSQMHAHLSSSVAPPSSSHNRSLVYNLSSVSLTDAADRYAVFNDIDSLPSIFESVSLSSSVRNFPSSTRDQ